MRATEHISPDFFTPPLVRKIISPVDIHAERQLATDGYGGSIVRVQGERPRIMPVTPFILLARRNRAFKAEHLGFGLYSVERGCCMPSRFHFADRARSAVAQQRNPIFSSALSAKIGAHKNYGVNGQ